MKLHESVKNMNDRVIICALIIGLTSGFSPVARGQQSDPVQFAPATMVGGAEGSTGGQSQSDVATANNPITPMNAIYFQNYYAPRAYGIPGSSNLLDLRGVLVSGRQLIRATLPISSGDDRNGNQQSGLGDFNVFDAIRVSPSASKDALAVGPMLVAPTATSRFLGQGKWQAGLAAVGIHSLSDGSLLIGILTWQHSFAGEKTRPEAQLLTFQPIAVLSIGGGYYVRSSGIWTFDIRNNTRLIPLGVGFGKVFKIGNALVNAFIEPQFTVYHNGTALPSFQLYSGLNFQFRKKRE
jgi:hypothetical protein